MLNCGGALHVTLEGLVMKSLAAIFRLCFEME